MTLVSAEMLLWLAGLVAGYWSLPRDAQLHWVSIVTAAFLFIYAPLSLAALAAVAAVCYFLGRRHVVAALTVCILMLLAYRGLSSGNPMQAVSFRDVGDQPVQFFILMGFSYYILRAVHYLLERFKGRLGEHNFAQLVHYLFFLPTLFVGPINRFDAFLRDERRRRWDPDQFSYGLTRIVYGFTKIVVVAYYLVNRKMGFWIPTLDQSNHALLQYVDCWQYALNLYFQFSGYSDVAIGVGALLGFRIMENFNFPFLQPNISEFWRNWHMSLTSWSREYVYPPVAASTRSPYLAIFAAMLFIGLWHEFSPKYLFWGLYHGGGIMAHRYYQRTLGGVIGFDNVLYRNGARILATVATLHFVVIGFILTKEDSLHGSWIAFTQLLGY